MSFARKQIPFFCRCARQVWSWLKRPHTHDLLRSSRTLGCLGHGLCDSKSSIHGDMLSSKEKSMVITSAPWNLLEDFHANDVTTSQIIKNVASDLAPWSHWTKATTHSTISNLEKVVWECNLAASVFCFLLLKLSHYQNLYVWTLTYVYKKFSGNRLP